MTKADKIRKLISKGCNDPKILAKKCDAHLGQVYPILKKFGAVKSKPSKKKKTPVKKKTPAKKKVVKKKAPPKKAVIVVPKADQVRALLKRGVKDPKVLSKETGASLGQIYPILKRFNEKKEDRIKHKVLDKDEIHYDDLKYWAKFQRIEFVKALEEYNRLKGKGKKMKAFWAPKGRVVVIQSK